MSRVDLQEMVDIFVDMGYSLTEAKTLARDAMGVAPDFTAPTEEVYWEPEDLFPPE